MTTLAILLVAALALACLLIFALGRTADIPTPKMTPRVDRRSFDYRLRALAAAVRDG